MARQMALDEQETDSAPPASTTPGEKKRRRAGKRKNDHNFVWWERDAQLAAFFAWLPKELHDAPGIDWTKLPPQVMGYCVRTIGQSQDSAFLAVAAAELSRAVSLASARTSLKRVYGLLRSIRATCSLQSLADLKHEQLWDTWAAHQEKTVGTRLMLSGYASAAAGHIPRYLHRLEPTDRERMLHYALPPPPVGLAEKYFPAKQMKALQKEKRKETTDVLVPLYPILRQLIRFRKQLAERTVLAIREAQRKVEAGEAELPYHFSHTDIIPEVNYDAKTIAEVRIEGREVEMKFILWDKPTWTQAHASRYCDLSVTLAKLGLQAYTAEHNCFFVQFDGPAADCFWFGDIVKRGLFRRFADDGPQSEDYKDRWQFARQLGFSKGCFCSRPGLLSSGDRWFAEAADRGEELIFEPESLYRGILYGAALAMIALSNGSRVSELLQVSWNKERRVTRTETVVVIDEDGHPRHDDTTGKPLTKQVKLHFQHLLPKGAKSEEERQLFPLSKEVMRLLGEMKSLLEQTHGEIPTVLPSPSNTKHEHLLLERYLFQWDASADGEVGALPPTDVQTLLRFILHGLDLFTGKGRPIRVSVHVLRHVMATHARHHRSVPPEAIAYFFLHHRLRELTGRDPSLPEISEYYTLMTEEQRFAIISADLDEQEEMDHALLQAAPSPRDLEQMNEDLRIIFELWHALHPTAFGYCGCPGLCPRGNDRALCLGCSYLVTDPERLGAALSWRESYVKQVELFVAQGNAIDARQARIKVQLLDDIINVMRLQLQAEADGSYIPIYKVLPSPHRKGKEGYESEN